MTKQEYVLLVAERLRELAEDGAECGGICAHLNSGFGVHWTKWRSLFREWPGYSGDVKWPVPGRLRPRGSFMLAAENGVLWRGEYGESRRDLADFMADWLEEHIEELCA